MQIHQFFFDHGIVVTKIPDLKTELNNNELISHNDRFSICSIDNFTKKKLKYVNKQKDFLEELLKTILQNKASINFSKKVILFNKQRRNEIFIPILFVEEKIGVYIHAWIDQTSKDSELLSLSNVKRYVTAGCLFGSTLKVKSENSDDLFTLIRSDIDFFSDKKFNTIVFEKATMSIYEIVLFHELARFAKLIQEFSPIGLRITLFYHFPYYDYILFVAILLIRNRITYEVFDQFYKIILARSDFYLENIAKIFEACAIDVIIESPYQNIFGSLIQRNYFTTEKLLTQLDINRLKFTEDLSNDEQKEKEKKFIQQCWDKLIKNKIDLLHQTIWEHFSTLYESAPNTFKELLERANAMMIARAAWKQESYTTCSLLSHSEKQIQIGYSKLLKANNGDLSKVINLTLFDSVVAYSSQGNIGIFSYDKKIKEIEKIVLSARKNLFFNAQKSQSIPIYSNSNHGLKKLQ